VRAVAAARAARRAALKVYSKSAQSRWQQEVWPGAPRPLAALIAQVIALLAPVELGLLRPPFHEPFHGDERGKAQPGQPRHRAGLSAGIGQRA
jgi:hypothetical protein